LSCRRETTFITRRSKLSRSFASVAPPCPSWNARNRSSRSSTSFLSDSLVNTPIALVSRSRSSSEVRSPIAACCGRLLGGRCSGPGWGRRCGLGRRRRRRPGLRLLGRPRRRLGWLRLGGLRRLGLGPLGGAGRRNGLLFAWRCVPGAGRLGLYPGAPARLNRQQDPGDQHPGAHCHRPDR
jgi:hypothetical protein